VAKVSIEDRCRVKLLIDECLSHRFVRRLHNLGYPDSRHLIHIGMLGFRDDQIVARAFADDRVIVTANGRDYKKLLSRMTLHPGAIIVEALEGEAVWLLLQRALADIAFQADPANYMVNRVVEVSTSGGVVAYLLANDAD
jgi:predicted nuclease of predicted toxin-antitoxin system